MRASCKPAVRLGAYLCTIGLLYMLVASVVVEKTIVSGAWQGFSRVTLHSLVAGTAPRPFVYRCLWPGAVRMAVAATPAGIQTVIAEAWRGSDRLRALEFENGYELGDAETARRLYETKYRGPQSFEEFERSYITEYVYAVLLLYLSLVGLAFVFRSLLRFFYPHSGAGPDIAPAVFLMLLPVFVSYFLYDYPNLFLFSLVLLLLFRRRWPAFWVAFTLACFSKETVVLVPMVWLLNQWRRTLREKSAGAGTPPPGRAMALLQSLVQRRFLAMCACWVAVMVITRVAYARNEGALLERHFLDNVEHILRWSSWLQFDTFLLPRGLNLLFFGALIYLVARNWNRKPGELRVSLVMLVPLFTLAFAFAHISELRMYYESLCVVLPLAYGGVVGEGRLHAAPVPEEAPGRNVRELTFDRWQPAAIPARRELESQVK